MAPTNSQINAAKDELAKDRREYFCIECGRPRSKNYCPWNAKHPKQIPHRVVPRKVLHPDSQLAIFLSNPNGADTKHVFK